MLQCYLIIMEENKIKISSLANKHTDHFLEQVIWLFPRECPSIRRHLKSQNYLSISQSELPSALGWSPPTIIHWFWMQVHSLLTSNHSARTLPPFTSSFFWFPQLTHSTFILLNSILIGSDKVHQFFQKRKIHAKHMQVSKVESI